MKGHKLHLRDILLFLAGAEFFQTLSHIILSYMVSFPLHTKYMSITAAFNQKAILLNGLITIFLLVWVSKVKR